MQEAAAGPNPAPDPEPPPVDAAARAVWQAMIAQPQAILDAQLALASAWSELLGNAVSGAPTGQGVPSEPLIAPESGDGRWKHPAWTSNPVFAAMQQAYLLSTRALLESVEHAAILDDPARTRLRIFVKHFCDALSPTNFAFLNPAVIEETARTGGKNFERGLKHLIEDATGNSGRPALVDRTAFTVGKNVATTRGSVVFRSELIELIQYEPTTPSVRERPLLIVPPWINKYYILDLQPANSFVKFATDNGLQTFVISWRNPDKSHAAIDFEDYLFSAVAAARIVCEIAGTQDLNEIGYCIGGTLTAMQLAYLAKTDPSLVHAATLFATLTDFSQAGDIASLLETQTVAQIESDLDTEGIFAAQKMSDAFNSLRANDLVWNVAVDRYLLGKPAPAHDLLFWNADATAMPAAMHAYYLRNMYVRNALAKGELAVDGVPIDLGAIANDVYLVAPVADHIAPWKSVYKLRDLVSADVRFRLGRSGHIAGIINPPGSGKGGYWKNDAVAVESPEAWLAGAIEVQGSWWPDWLAWVLERSGSEVARPSDLGSQKYPVLGEAPGTYVFG
jgi:polyhydroxyalkanoate synthase